MELKKKYIRDLFYTKRTEKGFTLEDMAEATGTSKSSYQRWESPDNCFKGVSIHSLLLICYKLEIDPSYVLNHLCRDIDTSNYLPPEDDVFNDLLMLLGYSFIENEDNLIEIYQDPHPGSCAPSSILSKEQFAYVKDKIKDFSKYLISNL